MPISQTNPSQPVQGRGAEHRHPLKSNQRQRQTMFVTIIVLCR